MTNAIKTSSLILTCTQDHALAEALATQLPGPVEIANFFQKTVGPKELLVAILRQPSEIPVESNDQIDQITREVEQLRTIAAHAPSHGILVVVQIGDRNAASFVRTLHLERPGLNVRILDFTLPIDETRHEILAKNIASEIRGRSTYSTVRFDSHGDKQVPMAVLREPSRDKARSIQWSTQDLILITGGGKGITAECALALSRDSKARIVLVGSSPGPETSLELARTMQRFNQENLPVSYYSCDLTDRASVQELVNSIQTKLGPITGLVHGAGLNQPRRAEQPSTSEILKEIGPKLMGANHLLDALVSHPLKLAVALSSVIGVTGMPGNAWYAFANESLDAAFRKFEEQTGVPVLSIAFSVWGETGMGARLGSIDKLGRLGIGAIPTSEGVKRFLHLFRHEVGQGPIVVTARLGGLDTWPGPKAAVVQGLRFIDKVERFFPGVELTVRTQLTIERDPYLEDHVYKGSHLFPTVFGLEAMAQAAAALLNDVGVEIKRLEEITLERPIVVVPGQGTTIEIHALGCEENAQGERSVQVGIRTEQTGFAVDHFAATLILGKREEAPTVEIPSGDALAIDPKADLYGDLLFQGERFQRMGAIYELDSRHVIFRSEAREPGTLVRESFGMPGFDLLLGDPFFRDVLLQAGQITIPQEECLPVGIDRIERFSGNSAGRRFVHAPEKIKNGREYTASIFTTDEHGRVLEKMTGYRLRILADRPDRPTAEELADPTGRDEKALHEELAKAAENRPLPTLELKHCPGLHGLPKQERRIQARPLVARALNRRLKTDRPFEITWESSGQPRLKIDGSMALEISISHDDHGFLCAIGEGPQGCDLAPIVARSREDWINLLGNSRFPLLEELIKTGESLDRAATRIWAAAEAMRKATQAAEIELEITSKLGSGIIFRAINLADRPECLTVPFRATFGPEKIVAVMLPTLAAASQTTAPQTLDAIPSSWHSVSVATDGPQGQPVQELRFVVSFQEASGISRKVPSSRYLSWMGKMRELVLSTLPGVTRQIATGEWGLVTNWGEVKVTGEATANDVVQMRFWTAQPQGAEVEFCCDFWKLGESKKPERIAFGKQKATWVKLIGHGQVRPEPLPADLAKFIEKMGPKMGASANDLPELTETISHLDSGSLLLKSQAGPQSARVLRKETVQTTLEESNLVGNVYFANYFAWQNRTRDLFLHSAAPNYLRGIGENGEFLVRRSRVDYLRESMPFERVEIVMGLKELRKGGITLGFDYFRVGENGREKLSVGEQDLIWVRRNSQGVPCPEPIPANLLALIAGTAALPKESAVRLSLPVPA